MSDRSTTPGVAGRHDDGLERESWLIQRLERPRRAHPLLGPDNPFSFGGGLRNGGLSDEAMGLLRGIFSFDYMGSAEFEFGAVPEALNKIAKRASEYLAASFTIPLSAVHKDFREKGPEPTGEATVYILCRADHTLGVIRRIRGWAKKPYGGLKEVTHLSSVLRPAGDWTPRVCGWLELDNGFFFFTDEAMWRASADLFGVETPAPVHAGASTSNPLGSGDTKSRDDQ